MIGVGGIRQGLRGGQLDRIGPEPRTGSSGTFGQVLDTVGTAVGVAAGKAAEIGGISGEYAGLLGAQIKVQQEMMLVSMYSNIEKSKHETSMAAVRNLRVG